MAGVKLGLLVAVLSPVIERSRDGLPRRGEVRFQDRLPTAFRRIAQGHYPRCYRRPPSRHRRACKVEFDRRASIHREGYSDLIGARVGHGDIAD